MTCIGQGVAVGHDCYSKAFWESHWGGRLFEEYHQPIKLALHLIPFGWPGGTFWHPQILRSSRKYSTRGRRLVGWTRLGEGLIRCPPHGHAPLAWCCRLSRRWGRQWTVIIRRTNRLTDGRLYAWRCLPPHLRLLGQDPWSHPQDIEVPRSRSLRCNFVQELQLFAESCSRWLFIGARS